MIGSLVGAAVSIGTAVAGGIKAKKAREAQEAMIAQQKAENQAWYDREYYTDAMDRSENAAVMGRVRDFMKRSTDRAESTAAITGATPESVLAQKAQAGDVISNTAANIAEGESQRKSAIEQQNQANKNAVRSQQMQQFVANEAAGGAQVDSGISMMGNAVSSFASGAGAAANAGQKGLDYLKGIQLDKQGKVIGRSSVWG